MAKIIRIFVADDHTVVREGLRALIETEPGMRLVGEAADGLEAVMEARRLKPDIILLDLMMPAKDGIDTIREITHENPTVRILILTSFAEDEKVFPAIKAGALGYLLKDSSPQELIQAIRNVHRGQSSLHPTIARKLLRELKHPPESLSFEGQLTEHEFQVLNLVARGLSNQEISKALLMDESAVQIYISSILNKLHLAKSV